MGRDRQDSIDAAAMVASSVSRHHGATQDDMLRVQNNLAGAYQMNGHLEKALRLREDLYSRTIKVFGEEDIETIKEVSNLALLFFDLRRYPEAKFYLLKKIPLARRILGEGNEVTLKMRSLYARALYGDPGATLDDLREAVNTLEETGRTARRVFGGAHPLTSAIGDDLRDARAALAARETPSPGSA